MLPGRGRPCRTKLIILLCAFRLRWRPWSKKLPRANPQLKRPHLSWKRALLQSEMKSATRVQIVVDAVCIWFRLSTLAKKYECIPSFQLRLNSRAECKFFNPNQSILGKCWSCATLDSWQRVWLNHYINSILSLKQQKNDFEVSGIVEKINNIDDHDTVCYVVILGRITNGDPWSHTHTHTHTHTRARAHTHTHIQTNLLTFWK